MENHKEQQYKEEYYDFKAKVLIVGDSKVGKSTLLYRYINKKPVNIIMPSTVGIDFKEKIVDVDNSKIKLILWDTAGQERFRPIIQNFYRTTKAAMLVFDITDPQSLEDLKYWTQELNTNLQSDLPKVIVANKYDLINNKCYDDNLLENIKNIGNMEVFFVSAITGKNVDQPFIKIAEMLKNKHQIRNQSQADTHLNQSNYTKKSQDTIKLQKSKDNRKKEIDKKEQSCC